MTEPAPAPRRRFPHTAVAFAAVVLLSFVRGRADGFVYDAAQYWGAPVALLTGGDVSTAGALSVRGVFTTIVYLPPAALSVLFGQGSAWLVVAWNGVLAAALCAVLLPRFAGLLAGGVGGRPPATRIWLSAIVGALLLSGFAPYPLMDVAATGLAMAGLYGVLVGRTWWQHVLAGLALSVAANLRPALLVAIALALVVVAVRRWRAALVAVAAGVVAVAAQVVFNVARFGQWTAVPLETGMLSAVQARFAAYAIRYDTVLFSDQHPQQWYCDADYAALLRGDAVPENQVEVVLSAASHLPDSVWFLFRKIVAAVHWTFGTPYEFGPGTGPDLMTVAVAVVAASGLVWTVAQVLRRDAGARSRIAAGAMLAFWFGTAGTLAFTTPETRFALPLVLVGLVGLVAALPARPRVARPTRRTIVLLVCAVALTAVVLLTGAEAMTHAQSAGPLTDAASCVATP